MQKVHKVRKVYTVLYLRRGRQVGHFCGSRLWLMFGSSGLDESQLQCWISCKTVARVGVGSMLHKDLDDVAVARDGCCMEGLQSCQRVQSTSNTAEQRSNKDPSTTEANNGDAVELKKKTFCIHQARGKQNVQNVPELNLYILSFNNPTFNSRKKSYF